MEPEHYIERGLEATVGKAAAEFPAVVVTGPRQSGKTTLLKHLYPEARYASLERPDVRESAQADPVGFLELHPPPVILDEIQFAPDLLPYVKERIDAERDRKGSYLLTGSQNLLLMEKVTETLAGRAAILRLLPLSEREIRGRLHDPLPWEEGWKPSPCPGMDQIWEGFLRGGFPELVQEPQRDLVLWYASYVQTYLERDVRHLRQIGDLTQFQAFLRMLASRSGQLLQYSDIGRDLGLSVNTVKAWVSVLEATHQIVIIRPYFANIGKRLVKTPKVYLTDVGLLCYLTGLRDAGHAAQGPMRGAIVETAVLSEIRKIYLSRGEDPQIYFWRTSSGQEVDFLVQHETETVPVEVKASATPSPSMASSLARLRRDVDGVRPGFLIHLGKDVLPLGEGALAVPFHLL
ncbi:MAG TPA: ATP-binding protein [Acidobacteriota bacterium]|nr:ATP-binding protein [Acidobacteriota bacterium]